MAEQEESSEALPDWQQEEYEAASLLSENRLIPLPTKWDVHEWEIMREFASAQEAGAVRDQLLSTVHGRGAFRSFKDLVQRHGIRERWFEYRDQALREIAISWCQEHGLKYSEL
jgi:hypothetical protein